MPTPSHRVIDIPRSAIHEMTRLSKQVQDVAFLSWAEPTGGAPAHIGQAVIEGISAALVPLAGGFDLDVDAIRAAITPRIRLAPGDTSANFCQRLLFEARVSTTPGGDFGPNGEGHLRLSYCVPIETIDTAFDRIERWHRSP